MSFKSIRTPVNIFSYLKEHIIDKWDLKAILCTLREYIRKHPQEKYSSLLILSKPINDPLFKTGSHRPNYWTFLICYHIYAPHTLYLGFSDHPSGIAERISYTNTVITSSNILYRQNNENDGNIIFKYIISSERNIYINIDWDTGRVLGPVFLSHK